MRKHVLALFLAVLSPFYVLSQHIETINGKHSLQDLSLLKKFPASGDTYRYLIFSYRHIPSEQETISLREKGLELIGFVPPSAYIARIKNGSEAFTDALQVFDAYAEVPAKLKLAPDLFELYEKKAATLPRSVTVSVYQPVELEILRAAMSARHINTGTDPYTGTSSLIAQLSGLDELQWMLDQQIVSSVQIHHSEITENYSNKSMQANQIHILNYDRLGPTGRNTYFANVEGFSASTNFRLNTKGRNHPVYGMFSPDLYTTTITHGNMVTMYATAANNVDEYENRGMAEGATIVQMPSYAAIETYYNNYNLKPLTLNVSAGPGDLTMTYDAQAREFDRITRSLQSYMLCMAAGNSGNSTNTTLNYGPGWANISVGGATNKNNFAVHAASNPGEHYEWASKGPAKDGRLKPDICTEGTDGTSSASPSMAGYVNVLFESYRDAYHTDPRSDVIKAVALNTAVDIDKKGIDFKTGFGIINPLRAHQTLQEKRIMTGSMPQGSAGTTQYQVTVPGGLREAKFLLYWHDYPGTVGAAKALVNNLDLKITSPSGQIILPWVLDPTPGNQYNLPLRKTDVLNNVEQVTIDDPEPGIYTVTINGTAVPFGPQEFVFTYDLLPYHIRITSPAPGFKLGSVKRVLFVWNVSLDTNNPANQLEIILQRETGQSALLATLPATQLYYSYIIPNTFPNTSTARLIVRQKNTPYADTSGYFQLMETPSGLSFRSICADRIALRWNALPITGTQYIIYRLGEKYMEEVARVDHPLTSVQLDAAAILGPGQTFAREEWFAIAARHPNGAVSLRSLPVSNTHTTILSLPLAYSKEYNLCLGDSVFISAHNLDRDSIRWYRNGIVLPGLNSRTIALKASAPGTYYYRMFQQGCVYTSDTITVKALLDITDTLNYGDRAWNIYAFKNHDPEQYYGRVVMYPLSVNTKSYYDDISGQINNMAGYEGCLIGKVYTLVYKRKGFAKGYYQMKMDYVTADTRLFINSRLVYTASANTSGHGVVWEGYLDEASLVRIVQDGNDKTHLGLTIEASVYAAPGSVSDGLKLWLDATKMAADTAGVISTWRDSFPYALKNSTESGADIRIRPAGINYNPLLVFDNNGGIHGKITTGSTNQGYTYAVFNMNDSSRSKARIIGFSFLPGSDDTYPTTYTPLCRIDSSGQIGTYKYNYKLAPQAKLTGQWNCMLAGMTPQNAFLSSPDTVLIQAVPASSGLFYTGYNIGTRYDSIAGEGRLRGELAEIIHYTRALSAGEVQRVYSYLALKYGFNMTRPYLSASGHEIYNAGNYSSNIAGIAREDRQDLMQKQSRSTEASPDVFTGSLGPLALSNKDNNSFFMRDSSFVIWGHNGAHALYTEPLPDSSMRLQRVWKLQHTGNAGIFRFNFDDTLAGVNSGCEAYKLMLTNDLANIASYRYHDTWSYRAADGKYYVYAETDLPENTILYFSLVRKRTGQLVMALPEHSRATIRCVDQHKLTLIDSTGNYAVAYLTTTSAAEVASIQNVSLHTDLAPAELAFCNDSSRITVINRLLYVNAVPSSGQSLQLRLYTGADDSLKATLNPSLATCDSFRTPLRWFLEESITALKNKINNAEPLSWIDAASVHYTTGSVLRYADITDLPLKEFILGAAMYDTTMPPPVIQSVNSAFRSQVSVYPNPFKNELIIEGAAPNSVITLYNMYGQCVFSSQVSGRITKLYLPLAAGVYFICVEDGRGVVYKQRVLKVGE